MLCRKLERHLTRAGLVLREGREEDVPALEELCCAANMYAGLDSLPANFAALLRQPTFKSLVALDAVSGRMVRANFTPTPQISPRCEPLSPTLSDYQRNYRQVLRFYISQARARKITGDITFTGLNRLFHCN